MNVLKACETFGDKKGVVRKGSKVVVVDCGQIKNGKGWTAKNGKLSTSSTEI
jgi:hypothetical protein